MEYYFACLIKGVNQRQNVMSFEDNGLTSSRLQMNETGIFPVLR